MTIALTTRKDCAHDTGKSNAIWQARGQTMAKIDSDHISDINEIARRILALPSKRRAYMVAILDAIQTDDEGITNGEADRLMDMLSAMKPLLDD